MQTLFFSFLKSVLHFLNVKRNKTNHYCHIHICCFFRLLIKKILAVGYCYCAFSSNLCSVWLNQTEGTIELGSDWTCGRSFPTLPASFAKTRFGFEEPSPVNGSTKSVWRSTTLPAWWTTTPSRQGVAAQWRLDGPPGCICIECGLDRKGFGIPVSSENVIPYLRRPKR